MKRAGSQRTLFSRQAVKHAVVDLVHPRIQESEEGSLNTEVRAQKDLVKVKLRKAVI